MKQFLVYACLAIASNTIANDAVHAPTKQTPEPVTTVIVSAISEGWRSRQSFGSDAASLLGDRPGYSVAQAGGVSGLPFMNGLGDDRLKIRIDGMEITSACANHMNAPLSYIAPTQIARIEAIAGVTPVSTGGDSIGGTITVSSVAPDFSSNAEELKTAGRISLNGGSNGNVINAGISASAASDRMSVGYSAAYARGDSYDDGNGERVLGSMYKSINQSVVFGFRDRDQLLTLRAGTQRIPYQGFPNQYMDMTNNEGQFGNVSYTGKFQWGELDVNGYLQQTDHQMGFFSPERTGAMPMVTHGRNTGYALKVTLPIGGDDKVRLGHEYHAFRLDDFWPAVPGSMMMGPQTYVNVNDGQRDRLALYGELTTRHDAKWSTLFGARWESVRMNTGNVQPYSTTMMNAADAAAAAAFNARDRHRRDSNLDLTALARFEAGPSTTYELAAARKTRSPNLYERYSWGRGTMAMTMTNWFGDGNGYVGDVDLRPETAYTMSFNVHWRRPGAAAWFVKLSPYYTHVQDYIDADVLASFNPYKIMTARGALLKFANHDAKLYGANLSWGMPVAQGHAFGAIKFTGNAALTRGARKDGGNLYHMMPLNALLALEQTSGAWTNQVEMKLVARKDRIDTRRLEDETGGYALLHVRSAYQLNKRARFSTGISNLLDKDFADPLGGGYLSGLKANKGSLESLRGAGRSFDIGLTIDL